MPVSYKVKPTYLSCIVPKFGKYSDITTSIKDLDRRILILILLGDCEYFETSCWVLTSKLLIQVKALSLWNYTFKKYNFTYHLEIF